jgi:hypothetical protein
VGKVALSIWLAFINDDVLEYMILRRDCNFKIFSQTLELLQCCVYYQRSTICISVAGSMNSYTQEVCLWWKQCISNLLKSCHFHSLQINEIFAVVYFQRQQKTELLILTLHILYILFISPFIDQLVQHHFLYTKSGAAQVGQ